MIILDLTVILDAPSPAQLGSNVELSCNWGQDLKQKQVIWYKGTDHASILWTFKEGVNGTHLENQASENFVTRLKPVNQTDYKIQHKILILNVTDFDQEVYWCEVIAPGITEHSPPFILDVVGKIL